MSAKNLPATTDDHVSALVIPDNEWADVDAGYVGEAPPSAAPVVPLLNWNAKLGGGFHDELTNTDTGEGETLTVVWLAWKESRAYWAEAFGVGDKTPTCRSNNMIVPDEASTEKQSATCASCPHSQWSDTGKPPACGVRVNAMLYLPDQQRITRTSFGGLAMKHVQRYLGGFETRLPRRPPMAFLTNVHVAAEETDNGKFLVPHFEIAGDITREAAVPLIQLRDELRKQWETLAAQDLETQETTRGADPFADDPDIIDVTDEDDSF